MSVMESKSCNNFVSYVGIEELEMQVFYYIEKIKQFI